MPTNTKRRSRFKKEVVFIIALLAAIVGGYMHLSARSADRGMLKVAFQRSDGTMTPTFKMHVASSQPERERGLMYRKAGYLQPDHGMLFIFPEEKVHSFWMKNTYLALDMIFVNEGLKVVGVLRDVPILNTKPRKVNKKSTFVIELLAGSAEKHRIDVGAELKTDAVFPRPTA